VVFLGYNIVFVYHNDILDMKNITKNDKRISKTIKREDYIRKTMLIV